MLELIGTLNDIPPINIIEAAIILRKRSHIKGEAPISITHKRILRIDQMSRFLCGIWRGLFHPALASIRFHRLRITMTTNSVRISRIKINRVEAGHLDFKMITQSGAGAAILRHQNKNTLEMLLIGIKIQERSSTIRKNLIHLKIQKIRS